MHNLVFMSLDDFDVYGLTHLMITIFFFSFFICKWLSRVILDMVALAYSKKICHSKSVFLYRFCSNWCAYFIIY